jgi:glutathione synthase
MSFKVAFVMDPLSQLNPKKDSTIAMAEQAIKRGWEVYTIEINALSAGESVQAVASKFTLDLDSDPWFNVEAAKTIALFDFDVVMMRKDPPFNMNYIYATYLLEMAEQQGATVVNSPASIRDANEKLYTLQFPQCTAPVLVTSDAKQIRQFLELHQDIILKPLDGMGGTSIFRVSRNDPNISVIIEVLTELGTTPIMAQKFIKEINAGDKRILMINGEAVPYSLARIPAKGETRGNLAAGGTGKVQPLTERDLWIANQVGPSLKQKGLLFVGLDVIGDYLTEINVTSPTCIREITAESDVPIAQNLMDAVAEAAK